MTAGRAIRPAQARPEGRAPGFTLIELLVSASVTVAILSAAYLCLQAGLRGSRVAESRMDIAQAARVALRVMAADLESACPLSGEQEFVGMERVLDGMDADNLDFATHHWTPRGPGEGDFCEISYFADRNPQTGQMGLWRRRDPSPDDRPFEGGSREEIAAGLRGLRFEYYDGFLWERSWGQLGARDRAGPESTSRASFSSLLGLPEAVRITIALTDPAATRPSRPGSPERAEPDAPLVFQTVVRLALAARASRASFSTSAGSGAPAGDKKTQGGGK